MYKELIRVLSWNNSTGSQAHTNIILNIILLPYKCTVPNSAGKRCSMTTEATVDSY